MTELTAVVGMHRSGTSLTTRVIDAMGVRAVGDEAALGYGDAYNATGYWETPELVLLNDRLLSYLGGDWHSPPKAPVGWETSVLLKPYRRRARALLKNIPGAHRSWKDPRMTLVLPFWRAVCSRTKYVVCFRHPLDVYRSLHRRYGMSVSDALTLWTIYSARALRDTSPGACLLLFYEDFFERTDDTLAKLAGFVGAERHFESTQVINRELRHHQATSDELIRVREAPREAISMWHALNRYRTGSRDDGDEKTLREIAAECPVEGVPLTLPHKVRRRWRWVRGTLKMMALERHIPT